MRDDSAKNFIALADDIRHHNVCRQYTPFSDDQIEMLAQYCQNQNAQFNRVDWLACVYQDFLQELETRSMSSWTDEELKRYSVLTGQEEQEQ